MGGSVYTASTSSAPISGHSQTIDQLRYLLHAPWHVAAKDTQCGSHIKQQKCKRDECDDQVVGFEEHHVHVAN